MSVVQCLREAVKTLSTTELIDEPTRELVTGALNRIINDEIMTPEVKQARLIAAYRELRRELFVANVTRRMDEQKRLELSNRLEQVDEAERLSTLRNMLEEDANYGATPVDGGSLSKRLRAVENSTVAQLNEVWNLITHPWKPWLAEGSGSANFHRELRGIRTGDAEAAAAVRKFREVVNPLLDRAEKAGHYIGRREDWGPQSHSQSRIRSDPAGWRKFLAENLDPEQHPDPAATAEHVWATLSTRDMVDPEGATLSMTRKLHFRTPEGEFEYFNRFGAEDFHFALHRNVVALARSVVLAEHLGPSAMRNVEEVLQPVLEQTRLRAQTARAEGNARQAKQFEREEAQGRRAQIIARSMTGNLQTPHNQTMANVMGATRQWAVTQMLGQVAEMIVGQDSVISMMAARWHTGGFARAVTSQLYAFAEVMGRGAGRRYAEELGVWTHALHAAAVDRFATPFARSEHARGIAGQAATATQRLSLSHYLERSIRSATMLTMGRAMGRMAQRPWAELSPKYRRVLEANGWSEGRWRELNAQVRLHDSGAIDVMALPQDLRERTLAYLYREVDLAVVYPDHYTRASLLFGGEAGTIPGELAATATQFWSWPLQLLRGPLRREWSMGLGGFAGFSAGLALTGALTTQMRAVVNNEPVFEWDSPTLWLRALGRSGLLTPVGDMVVNQAMYQRSGIVGPVGGMLESTATLGYHGITAVMDGETDRAARALVQYVRDVAVPNLWQTELALTNRAMDNIMWSLDPKYMRDRERRWRNEGRAL